MRITIGALALVLLAGLAGPAKADEPPRDETHPAAYFQRAAELMRQGRRDEAVFWFYVGQLRYRAYLMAHPRLDPSGDPALFASLTESVGRPLNQYAFGNIPELAATMTRVLAWDRMHPDPDVPEADRLKARAGLASLRAEMVRTADTIRAQRRANGLENRP